MDALGWGDRAKSLGRHRWPEGTGQSTRRGDRCRERTEQRVPAEYRPALWWERPAGHSQRRAQPTRAQHVAPPSGEQRLSPTSRPASRMATWRGEAGRSQCRQSQPRLREALALPQSPAKVCKRHTVPSNQPHLRTGSRTATGKENIQSPPRWRSPLVASVKGDRHAAKWGPQPGENQSSETHTEPTRVAKSDDTKSVVIASSHVRKASIGQDRSQTKPPPQAPWAGVAVGQTLPGHGEDGGRRTEGEERKGQRSVSESSRGDTLRVHGEPCLWQPHLIA